MFVRCLNKSAGRCSVDASSHAGKIWCLLEFQTPIGYQIQGVGASGTGFWHHTSTRELCHGFACAPGSRFWGDRALEVWPVGSRVPFRSVRERAVHDGYTQVLIWFYRYCVCHLPTQSRVHLGGRGTPCLGPRDSPWHEEAGTQLARRRQARGGAVL